jgi:hypothetical protein
MKLSNHIVEIYKNFWGLLRHQTTCHSAPFPVYQNSATPVARTSITLSSRQGSALRSTRIGVLICWQLDLQVLRASL